jgi:hypothetical protein
MTFCRRITPVTRSFRIIKSKLSVRVAAFALAMVFAGAVGATAFESITNAGEASAPAQPKPGGWR